MTEVSKMTDAELDRELSHIEMTSLGWKLVRDSGPWIRPSGRYSTGRYRHYCTVPDSSLDIQEVAMKADEIGYMAHLTYCAGHDYHVGLTHETAASMLRATPRQRAEAAYMTLKGE